jgi:serine phosphatase RsbU (regulator of sigma subunit)
MGDVRQELGNQVAQLCNLPFHRIMGKSPADFDLLKDPSVSKLMAGLGNGNTLVESLEFIPQPPPPAPLPSVSRLPGKETRPLADHAREAIEPAPLVVFMSHLNRGTTGSNPSPKKENVPASEMGIPVFPGSPPSPPVIHEPPPIDQERIQAEIKQAQEAARAATWAAGVTSESVADIRRDEIWKKISEAEEKALEIKRNEMKGLLGQEFGSEVRREGEVIGTVKAQVSSEKVLSRVLSRTRHQQEEIPFALDGDGKLYTANPSDRSKLEGLPLQNVVGTSKDAAVGKSELGNWIVVTRKDPGSNLSFGIARPILQTLQEFRRTAVRNFSYGLGMVGLALIGILPLSGSLTRNLNLLTEGAKQMAQGHWGVQVPIRSRDELGRLTETFNQMARQLEENQKRLVEQERLQKELELCRHIQEELLPRYPLRMGLAEVKGVSIPAREVGGDFFNYFSLPDGNIALLVGDVSGKGVPAALLMANLQATLRARLPLEKDLAKLSALLDHDIASSTPPEVYLTLFVGILESDNHRLCYVNAGHNTQYALRAHGGLERLESTGRPLGLLPGEGFAEHHVTLSEGDSLFLYTDGLVETENSLGEEFGCERLEAILVAEHGKGLDHLITRVEQAVRSHRGAVEATDDATIMALKIRQA